LNENFKRDACSLCFFKNRAGVLHEVLSVMPIISSKRQASIDALQQFDFNPN
jgi:hypothetical protein